MGYPTNRRYHQLIGAIILGLYFNTTIPSPEENIRDHLYYHFFTRLRIGMSYNDAFNIHLQNIQQNQVLVRQQNNHARDLESLRIMGENMIPHSPQFYAVINIIDECNLAVITYHFGEGIRLIDILDAMPCIREYYDDINASNMDRIFAEIFDGDEFTDVVNPQTLSINCKTTSFFVSMQECGICYETSTARLQCTHEFCGDCIDTYLTNIKQDHRMNATCPMCRSAIQIIETSADQQDAIESSIHLHT